MFRKIGSADDVETLRLILKVVDDLIRYRGRIEWDQQGRHVSSSKKLESFQDHRL
jgi:hypothetical protein